MCIRDRVVTRDLPPGSVAFGNPAVVRGRVEDLTAITSRVEADDLSFSRFRFASPERVPNGDGIRP